MASSFSTDRIIAQTVTAYAWTGTANASASTKSVNGTVQRTNYVVNPNVESDLGSWQATGTASGGAIARDTTTAYVGSASLRVTLGTADLSGAQTYQSNVPTGAAYTASAWVKAPAGLTFRLRCSNNSTLALFTVATGTGDWQRVQVTMPSASTTAAPSVQIVSNGANNGGTVYVDAVMLEVADSAGDYFDGSTAGSTVNIYETASPLVVTNYEAIREVRHVFNPVLNASSTVAVVSPLGLRSGTMTAVFTDRTSAFALENMLRAMVRVWFRDSDVDSVAMGFLPKDSVRVYQAEEDTVLSDGTTTTFWYIEFGFQEVDA